MRIIQDVRGVFSSKRRTKFSFFFSNRESSLVAVGRTDDERLTMMIGGSGGLSRKVVLFSFCV